MQHDAGRLDPTIPMRTIPTRESPTNAGRVEPTPLPRPAGPNAPLPPGLTAAPDLMGLLAALRRRWVSAVLLGGTLGAIASVAVWYALTPKYTAFAHLQVRYSGDALLSNAQPSAGDFKATLQTTAAEVATRRVIAAALKRDEVRRLNLDSKEIDPAQAIQEDLRVEFKENSELLTIYYSHPDPHVATTVLNGVKDAYLEEIVYARQRQRKDKVSEFEKLYTEKSDEVAKKKNSLKDLAEKLGTIDPALWREQRLEVTQNLKDLKLQHANVSFKLIEARAELETYDARVAAIKKFMDSVVPPKDGNGKPELPGFDEALELAMEKDAEARRYHERVLYYQDQDATLARQGYPPNYVSRKIARDKAAAARASLEQRKAVLAERVRTSLARAAKNASTTTNGAGIPQFIEDPAIMRERMRKQIDALTSLESKLEEQIKVLSKEAAKTPVLASEYEQRVADIKVDEKLVHDIGTKLEHERVELRAANRITKFQDAELMKRDNKKQLLAAGISPIAVLGAVSIGLAWLEFRKRRVRTASEISRGLGIRVVGAVPAMPHLEHQLVNAAGESELEGTPVMESIDAIRTRLLHEANTRSTRVVMVTSAASGEGKTTLAAALATSLARAGRKTLLLDGDLRRPAVHELFELAMQPGFSEVLLGEIEMADAAVASMQENLWVMPAGQWDREVLLALSRDGLEGMFELLAEEFDFIVVDSHPVLAATDSLLIGRQADAVLLSVLRDVSEMPRVYAASQQLSAVGIRVIGAVVNAACPEEVYVSSAAQPVAV